MQIHIQITQLHFLQLLLAGYLIISYFANWCYQRLDPQIVNRHKNITRLISLNAGVALLIAYGIAFSKVVDLILRWTTPHAILMFVGLSFAVVASLTTLLSIISLNYQHWHPQTKWLRNTITGISAIYIALLVASLF